MKKLFTLFVGLLAASAMFAQGALLNQPRQFLVEANSQKPTHGLRNFSSTSRSAGSCDTLQLDYSSYYELWANTLGLTFNGSLTGGNSLQANEVTSFVDTAHGFYDNYIKSVFDTLSYVDVNNEPAFLPLSASTIKLDSLGMEIGISGDSTKMQNDSLVFTIYKRVGTIETTVKTVVISGPSWFENFYVDPGYLHYAQVGIDYQFNQGEGFAIRMDYLAKDTSSHCLFAYTYADSCGTVTVQGQNFTSPAFTPPFGKISYSGEIIPNGATAAVSAANNTQTYNLPGVPVTCKYAYEQVYDFFPILSVCLDYGTTIVPAQQASCPRSVVDVSSIVYGTQSQNITYTWSAINGTITSNGNSTTSVVMGDSLNVSVILNINDGANTTADTVVILNKAIHVHFSSPTFTIACGGSGTLIPLTSGNQTGIVYTWNTGSSTSTLLANIAVPYSVTVTNNSSCNASATVNVVYPNVSNTVTFTPPPPPICRGTTYTFTNNSTQTSGWTSTWDMGNQDIRFDVNPAYSYATAGSYAVKLTMDSAGCSFSYTRTVNVVVCSGIEETPFGNTISLLPNPSSGNVAVTVNGAQKNISIKVYNVIGSEVQNFNSDDVPSTFTKNFDFNNLSNGTYLMKIQSGDKTAVKRFTINK